MRKRLREGEAAVPYRGSHQMAMKDVDFRSTLESREFAPATQPLMIPLKAKTFLAYPIAPSKIHKTYSATATAVMAKAKE